MNDVKVFPLRFSKEFHANLAELAKENGMSLHAFIIEVLERQIKESRL